MKGYASSSINVCVIGEFVSTINLTNFLHNQNGLKVSYLEVDTDLNFSWLINLENQIYQSDVLIVSSDDVNINCTIILTAFKNNTPVILFDEQTYFVAGDYLRTKGSLMLASNTLAGSIGSLLAEKNEINNPVVMGITLPSSISKPEHFGYMFSLGVLCNSFNADLIQERLIGLEATNAMDAAIRISQMRSSSKPLCDYIIVPDQEPNCFILDKDSKKKVGDEYSFYSFPLVNNYKSLIHDIESLIQNSDFDTETYSGRKYNISGLLTKKISAGEIITKEHLNVQFEPHLVDVSDSLDTVPWSLLEGCELKVDLNASQQICFSDVEMNNSLALGLWHEMLKNNFGRRYNVKDKKVKE